MPASPGRKTQFQGAVDPLVPDLRPRGQNHETTKTTYVLHLGRASTPRVHTIDASFELGDLSTQEAEAGGSP